MNEFEREEGARRVGAGPRLAAALLDYVMSTIAVMVAAWNGWGWSAVMDQLPGSEELTELYAPSPEAALVQAGLRAGCHPVCWQPRH